jgi:NAD(P)H-dependent FMN reductase
MKIVIISSSVRTGRNSQRVALYLRDFIKNNYVAQVEIADLAAYDFPVFKERLRYLKDPDEKTLQFAGSVRNADGIIIVTPEYNGGYPAALKNVTDLLDVEWKRKPVALCTVSSGPFGGAQVTTSLLFTLWKIGALMVPAKFPVPKVQEAFGEDGTATDLEGTAKRARSFVDELVWCIGKVKSGQES